MSVRTRTQACTHAYMYTGVHNCMVHTPPRGRAVTPRSRRSTPVQTANEAAILHFRAAQQQANLRPALELCLPLSFRVWRKVLQHRMPAPRKQCTQAGRNANNGAIPITTGCVPRTRGRGGHSITIRCVPRSHGRGGHSDAASKGRRLAGEGAAGP